MDLSVFRCLSSNDPNVNSEANRILTEAISSPPFFDVLINLLSSPDVQSDPGLSTAVSLVLCGQIRMFSRSTGDFPNFVSQCEWQKIISLVFQVPCPARPNLVESLSILLQILYPQGKEIIEIPMKFLSESSDPNATLTALTICAEWSKKTDIVQIHENYAEEMTALILPLILPICQQCVSNLTDENIAIMTQSAKIVRRCFKHATNSLLTQQFAHLVSTFADALIIPQNPEGTAQMKHYITTFFFRSIRAFTGSKDINSFAHKFSQTYSQTILPEIIRGITGVLPLLVPRKTLKLERLLSDVLFAIYLLCYNGLYQDIFLSQDFVLSYLLPSTQLTAAELQDFDQMPEQYIAFDLDVEMQNVAIPRRCAILITSAYRKFSNLIPFVEILSSSDSSDLNEFEAKVFLLQNFLIKKKIPPQLNEKVIQLLSSEQPPFLVATMLRFLLRSKSKSAFLRDISATFLFNSESIVVKICAIELLRESLSRCNELGDLSPSQLLSTLLSLMGSVADQRPGLLIQFLAEAFPNETLPFSVDMLSKLFETWKQMNEEENTDEDQMMAANELIESAISIVENQPNENTLAEMADPIIEFATSMMVEFPESYSLLTFISLCAVFCRKLKSPPKHLLQIIPTFASMIIQQNQFVYLMPNYASVVVPLILKGGSGFFDDNELVGVVIDICDRVLKSEEEEGIRGTVLAILAMIVFAGGEKYFELVGRSIDALEKREEMQPRIGAVYLLTAALRVGLKEIPSEVAERWIEISDLECFNREKDQKVCIIGLLEIYEKGFAKAANAIAELTAELVKKVDEKGAEQSGFKEEEEEENAEEEWENYDQQQILPDEVETPFDGINVFKEVSQSFDKHSNWDLLSGEIRDRIIELSKN